MTGKRKLKVKGLRIFDRSLTPGFQYIGRVNSHGSARRIVTAVNCHEELVGLVEEYVQLLALLRDDYQKHGPGGERNLYEEYRIAAVAALAKAREEK